MRRIFRILLAIFVITFAFWRIVNITKADINSDCQNEDPNQIYLEGKADVCTQILQSIAASIGAANTTNQKNLSALQSQLNNLNSRLNALSAALQKAATDISNREENMGFTQQILNQKTRDYYTFLRLYDPITPFLFADSASNAFQELSLRQKAQSADVNAIEQYVNEITDLKNSQASLQKTQVSVSAVQKQISSQTTFLAGEVAKANAYLATLSARQESFIAAKLESLGISRSAYNLNGGCSSDINPYKAPNFSGPEFAFFTFGVPNRVGLNQYGAAGRANAGQNAQTILSAYYNADYTTGYNQSINIHVVGTNEYGQSINQSWQIDDYLKHLYEMPASFPAEALKAQAIAARSYALAYTNNGSGSICPSQQCQVVKVESHGDDAWSQAVDATRGIVLTNSGAPIKAWFSATHGGYAYTTSDIGWSATAWTKRLVDTSGPVNSFSDLMNNSYDKSSPVFYCDWGGRASENKTAWLSSTDLADIVNAVLLAEKDGSTKSHLYQPDKPNPEGTDTWSSDQVKSNLGSSAFNTITGISINADFGTGKTTSVTVSGDAPSQTINGDDFKNYFNIRAPANIQIVGPLYNIEKH
jgi:SpoIID/LytB domain protein